MTRWTDKALCLGLDVEIFFPPNRFSEKAKAICRDCPVRLDCLTEALAIEENEKNRFGIFGGMTPQERNDLMKGRIN